LLLFSPINNLKKTQPQKYILDYGDGAGAAKSKYSATVTGLVIFAQTFKLSTCASEQNVV
jgi:uncharacterized FAD-dependent dehydrogenase